MSSSIHSPQHFHVTKLTAPCQHIRNYPTATLSSQEAFLQVAVKKYTPLYEDGDGPQPGDMTILASHASGFSKEMYEPLWDALYEYANRTKAFRIRAIWIADVANQGDSGLLNEDVIANDPSYYDYARDMLSIVNTFRDQMPRPIFAIGHSMGGNVVVNLALLHPRLLSGLVAMDPVINRSPVPLSFAATYPLVKKKDIWPSREAATAYFARNPLSKRWDPRVTKLWLEHGLCELPTKLYKEMPKELRSSSKSADAVPLTQKTTKHQEFFSFARPAHPSPGSSLKEYSPPLTSHPDLGSGEDRSYKNAWYRPELTMTFTQLPFVRPRCLYIHGAESHMAQASEQGRKDKMEHTGIGVGGNGGMKTGAVSEKLIEGGSHFFPFEKPDAVGETIGSWLGVESKRWHEEEAAEYEAWTKRDVHSRTVLGADGLWWIDEHYKPVKQQGQKKQSKL